MARTELHERKLLIVVGMDIRGVVFWELLPENQTINAERYRDFLDRRISDWAMANHVAEPIILHDNARPHKAQIVRELLESKNWTLLPHPAYSPDMNPSDFNCFGPLKEKVKGKRYSNPNELVEAIRSAILELNQNGTFNGVSKLPEVWAQVVEKSGSY